MSRNMQRLGFTEYKLELISIMQGGGVYGLFKKM